MSSIRRINTVKEPIRILRKIREVLPTAIIAGGYYRDIYHNIPFSDVDIFIDTHTFNTPTDYPAGTKYSDSTFYREEFWKEMFELNLGVNNHRSIYSNDYIEDISSGEEYEDDEIELVWEISYNDIKYNIILIAEYNPIDFVKEKFDFGICKVYSDGNKISFSKEFLHDSKNKLISFTDYDVSYEFFCYAMKTHLEKIKEKYPTHTVFIPTKHLSHAIDADIKI